MTEIDDEIPPAAEPSAPPKRQLFFARLAEAVRRQDWFVVALEVTIVVLGVLIGFQVTAWGQARHDRAKERAYLVQLAEDARETVRRIDEADSTVIASALRKNALLLRSFRSLEPPPRDSFLTWLQGSTSYSAPLPVTATAEAINQSGDLGLIREDSLRRALPAYLERSASRTADARLATEGMDGAYRRVALLIDGWQAAAETVAPDILDSLATDDTFPLPAGPRRSPFPIVVEDVLRDRGVYGQFNINHTMLRRLRRSLQASRTDAAEIIRLVEAAQDEVDR